MGMEGLPLFPRSSRVLWLCGSNSCDAMLFSLDGWICHIPVPCVSPNLPYRLSFLSTWKDVLLPEETRSCSLDLSAPFLLPWHLGPPQVVGWTQGG